MDEFTKKVFAERERQDVIYAQRALIGEVLRQMDALDAPIDMGVDWWERQAGNRAEAELITGLLHADDALEREVLTGRTA